MNTNTMNTNGAAGVADVDNGKEDSIKSELLAMCENYRDELDAVERGVLFENNDGEFEVVEDEDERAETEEREEREPVTLRDWIERRSLDDIRFEVNQRGECNGAGRILVDFGGPNVWLHSDRVMGYWGSETVCVNLFSRSADLLSDFFSEEWDMIKESI